jgi:hypothetical protein
MPRTPVSRLVRFTLADGTSVIFDHLGYRRPTVHPVRVNRGRRDGCLPRLQPRRTDRQRLTCGGVERYLAQLLAARPGDCGCGRSVLAPGGTTHRVYAIASGWQCQIRATRSLAPTLTYTEGL